MIPRLRAEEAWTTMLATALGSGHLTEQDAAKVRAEWLAAMAAESAPRGRAEQLLVTAQQMGIEVER